MTLRDHLRALRVGESVTFASIDAACSAAASGAKFYDGRRFTRSGATITRVE